MNKITVNVNNNNDQIQNNNQNNEKYLEDFINNPSWKMKSKNNFNNPEIWIIIKICKEWI